eukprot:766259-Hanusia_phi.AAC.4
MPTIPLVRVRLLFHEYRRTLPPAPAARFLLGKAIFLDESRERARRRSLKQSPADLQQPLAELLVLLLCLLFLLPHLPRRRQYQTEGAQEVVIDLVQEQSQTSRRLQRLLWDHDDRLPVNPRGKPLVVQVEAVPPLDPQPLPQPAHAHLQLPLLRSCHPHAHHPEALEQQQGEN